MTTGRFSIVPKPRIATLGWLITGKPNNPPKTPGFVMANVPSATSSGLSFLARAFGKIVHRTRNAEKVFLFGIFNHRYDQSPIQSHRDADIAFLVQHDVGS